MARRIGWGQHQIVVLDTSETIINQCEPGDAAIYYGAGDDEREAGWYVTFMGADGGLNGWDDPFDSADAALTAIPVCTD